jgi:hypothetical protein
MKMDAEKTQEKPSDIAPKASEAPPIKLDDVRPKKAEPATTAAPKPAVDKPAASPKLTAPKPADKASAAAALPLVPRLTAIAETHGYYAAAAMVVLGIGWIIGANSFDNRASEKRVTEALVALDHKIDQVSSKVVAPSEVAVLKRNVDEVKRAVDGSRRTAAAITDLRNKLDASDRNRATAADGIVDKVAERVSKDQGDRLDKLAGRLDKIEQQLASQIPTASIPTPQARAAEPVQVPGVTMPMAAAPKEAKEAKKEEHTTVERNHVPENGYVLRDVYRGVAVVEGRRGLLEVAPGDTLPGAGRVRAIERRNRQWVVVTTSGVIDASGY